MPYKVPPPNGEPWTPAQVERLKKLVKEKPRKQVYEAFPKRTVAAVRAKIKELKINTKKWWKEDEDARLLRLWGVLPFPTICKALNRSPLSVYCRAVHVLKLKGGCPPGWETVTKASVRYKCSVYLVRKVLKDANIEPIHPYTISKARTVNADGGSEGLRGAHNIVRVEDVDSAFAVYNTYETVNAAAARHCVYERDLRQWLKESGHVAPPRKQRWVLPKYVFDDVVKVVESTYEKIGDASARVGVSNTALRGWFKEAGISYDPFRMKKADVDRIVAAKRADPNCHAWGHRGTARRKAIEERQRARREAIEARRQQRIKARDERRAKKAEEAAARQAAKKAAAQERLRERRKAENERRKAERAAARAAMPPKPVITPEERAERRRQRALRHYHANKHKHVERDRARQKARRERLRAERLSAATGAAA